MLVSGITKAAFRDLLDRFNSGSLLPGLEHGHQELLGQNDAFVFVDKGTIKVLTGIEANLDRQDEMALFVSCADNGLVEILGVEGKEK